MSKHTIHNPHTHNHHTINDPEEKLHMSKHTIHNPHTHNHHTIDDPEEKLHKRHAQEKLKKLFASRKSLFQNRIKPVDSSEEENNWSSDDSVHKKHKIPHASDTNRKISVKEKILTNTTTLTWVVVPEIIFILLSFFDVLFSTFLITMGITGVSWRSSIDSIVEEHVDHSAHNHSSDHMPVHDKLFGMGKDYNMVNFNIRVAGIILVVGGIAHVINSIIGTQVAFRGMKNALRLHCVVAILLLLIELGIGGMIYGFGSCDPLKFSERYEEHFFNMYTIGTHSKLKIDAVQSSVGCCGLTEPVDYLKNLRKMLSHHHHDNDTDNEDDLRKDVAGDITVLPQSCCDNWWIHNILCASKVHEFTTPGDADSRLSSTGCITKVANVCERIIRLMGRGVLIAALGHTCMLVVTMICIAFQTKIIESMENASAMKARQAEDLCMGIYDDEPDDASVSSNHSWHKIIQHEPKNLNEFEKRIKSHQEIQKVTKT